jgi:hypothetical protein
VAVSRGELRIDFVNEVEYPCIAAIEVVGDRATRKVNCGGPGFQDYAADVQPERVPRDLPVADFYADWAAAQFGPQAGPVLADVLRRLDGNCPAVSTWNRGPGVIAVSREPWGKAALRFAFVEEFAAARPRVQGVGNLARFEWWLNALRLTREMGHLGCARGELDAVMERIAREGDPQVRRRMAREQALPVRLGMVAILADLYDALLGTLNNTTELGTIANLEQQSLLRVQILEGHDARLREWLGESLPAEAAPPKEYGGRPRLVVMNPRTQAGAGEALRLRIVLLDRQPPRAVSVHLRPLGSGEWRLIRAAHLARAVYQAALPGSESDFEYYVEASPAEGGTLRWPVTAPGICQTVVVSEGAAD